MFVITTNGLLSFKHGYDGILAEMPSWFCSNCLSMVLFLD